MDYIKRFTTRRRGPYVFSVVTTDTVETARGSRLWPVATAALGRAMTGAILLAGTLKTMKNVSLRIQR